MHELVEAVISKYQDKHKEVEEYLRNQGEAQITYSTEQIRMLIESDKIPKELGEWFLKNCKNQEAQYKEIQEFVKNNPDIPVSERHKYFFKEGSLSPEESAKIYEDSAMSGQFFMYLLKNRHLLGNDVNSQEIPHSLFNGVNVLEEFGIANCISNSLYHLTALLKNMELINIYETMFEAKSSVKNTKGEAITLAYTFPANTRQEAESILKNYQSTMVTKGLKILMAHWMMANKMGCVDFSCPMIEIMKLITDEEREAFFSVKEKEEHWSLTKMLAS